MRFLNSKSHVTEFFDFIDGQTPPAFHFRSMAIINVAQVDPFQYGSHPHCCCARQLLAAAAADIDTFLGIYLQSLASSLVDCARGLFDPFFTGENWDVYETGQRRLREE